MTYKKIITKKGVAAKRLRLFWYNGEIRGFPEFFTFLGVRWADSSGGRSFLGKIMRPGAIDSQTFRLAF